MDGVTHAIRRERWKAIIKECNESGMSKKDWLAQHKINSKTYYNWQKKLRMEIGTEMVIAQNNALTAAQGKTDFCQLTPPVGETSYSSAVIRTDRFSIELNENISDEFLLRLFRAASHV